MEGSDTIARLDSAPAYFAVTPPSSAELSISIKNGEHVSFMSASICGISVLFEKTTKHETGWKPPHLP